MTLEIGVKARVGGGESLSKLANDIREVQKASGELAGKRTSYFQHLRRDAEAYSGNLKDQIRYIREQIGLDRQRATEGHRMRMFELQGDTLRRSMEMRSHLEMGSEGTEAREQLSDWMRSRGIGVSSESGMFDTVAGGFAQGGIMGGTRGMLGSMLSRARGMGALKLGGAATAAYVGYKVVKGLSEGFGGLKSLEQGLVNIYGLMRKIPEDTSRFRKDLELAALASGVMGENFTGMSASWMTLANAPSPNLGLMKGDIRTGRAYGISTDFSAIYADFSAIYGARLARMGYWNLPKNLPSSTLAAAINARQLAGLSNARSQEFLELIESVTGTVTGTAGAVDISRMMAISMNVARLGEPFQRERGAQFISGLHSGLTGGGGYGITFLAAQQALFKKTGKMPSYGQVELYRAGGLNEPGFFEEVYQMNKSIFRGADPETRAVMFARAIGSTDYKKYYKALPLFESGDIAAGRDIIFGEMHKSGFKKRMEGWGGFKIPPKKSDFSGFILPGQASMVPETETDLRIRDIEGTFGFRSQKYGIAVEIGKIEASATLFEKGANIFYQGVVNMLENVLAAPQSNLQEGLSMREILETLHWITPPIVAHL